eukprot:7612599-Pyramimonas_sp.AAC.1
MTGCRRGRQIWDPWRARTAAAWRGAGRRCCPSAALPQAVAVRAWSPPSTPQRAHTAPPARCP